MPPPSNGYGKLPKKQRPLLPDKHSAGAVFFPRSGFFFFAYHIINRPLLKGAINERAVPSFKSRRFAGVKKMLH